jgi:imidazolonepropionase-like amidohydrolase
MDSLKAQSPQRPPEDEKELPAVSRTYAITNAIVTQAPGRKIERGIVIVKDGLIQSVGKNLVLPADAIVIKADSMYVYAGFIDGLSRTGVVKPREEPNRERPKDPGNPLPEVAGITPQQDVRASLNPFDKSVEELRSLGFTVAQVVPYGGMLPGNGAIIVFNGKSADEMILVGKSSLFAEIISAQRVYPNTVIGIMAKWRELYRQAIQSKNYESLYASNRSGLNRPTSNIILEAFYPVIDKKIPVLFEADKYLETQRIFALQADLGFALTMGDLKEGWDAIPKIKASNTKVFLSLHLPEDKKEPKKDSISKKVENTNSKKVENAKTMSDAEKEALERRKAEAIALYNGQATAFQKAGIVFGFSTLTTKPTDIKSNFRKMIAAGLTEDQLLSALTTSPATLLGLSDRIGTIDAGKIANLVITDKPYFNEKSNVRYVFVDGVMYQYDTKETPKVDPTMVVNITGTWSVTSETPQGKNEEKVTIRKDGNAYSGSVTGTRLQQAVPLENVELNGNKLRYSYTVPLEGQSIKIDVDATIEGDTFKGAATAGRFGTFSVEGKKDPNH